MAVPSESSAAWLRTVIGLLVAALLLDYAAMTTPVSAALDPGVASVQRLQDRATRDPRLTRRLFVDKLMPAAQASKDDRRFRALGRRAQALWITDYYPVKSVRRVVRAYTDRANRAGRTPVVALYAIPGRDCGLYSSGGLTPKVYARWATRVARGLRGQHAIAIVEPDAVAFLGDCEGQGPRARLLRSTVRKLTRADVWTYLDAGHAGWHRPAVMAERLRRTGIRHARGFSTNIGSLQG